jgi:hypothetical protein
MSEVSGTIVLDSKVLSLLINEVAVDADWPLAVDLL